MEETEKNNLPDNNTNAVPEKKKKERKTLFWGVNLKTADVFSHEVISNFLVEHPGLIPLKSIHSTLLYVGRKDNEDEKIYFDYCYRECVLEITGFGYSEKAMALKVDKLIFKDDGTNVPSFAEIQHVTLALSEDTKAVESVKTLEGEENFVAFEKPLVVEGKIFRY